MSETARTALENAVAHLEEAKRELELAAPIEGTLDLLAQSHIATACVMLEASLRSRSAEKARAAAVGG